MLLEAPQLKSPVLSSDIFFCFSTEEMPVVDDVGGADEERESTVVEPNTDPPPAVGNAAQEETPDTANEVKEEVETDNHAPQQEPVPEIGGQQRHRAAPAPADHAAGMAPQWWTAQAAAARATQMQAAQASGAQQWHTSVH